MEDKNIFEQGSIAKTYASLALPVTLGMVLNVVYNVADTYFIARTQDTNLVAAVSLCAPVFTLLMAIGNIFGQGGTSMISRLFGRNDREGTKRVSSFCFWAALLVGIVGGAVMLLFTQPVLRLLGATEATLPHARAYYMTLGIGAPLVVLNFIHMNLLRAEGMAKESMLGSVSGLAVNIVLDPIFISVLGWGAFGAALASVIGYAFSDVLLLLVVLKKSKILSVDPRLARAPGKDIGQIFAIGVSAALTNVMSSICLVMLNQYLLPYGNDHIAAMGIAQKVSMIILLILTGMSFGAAPIVGYFYGGRQFDRLRELLKFLLRVVGGTAIVMTAVLFAAARPAISMFLRDETVVDAGTVMLRWQISTMILAAGIMIATICFQASGKAVEALVTSVLRQGVIFFIVIALLSRGLGYTGVIAAQAVTDLITAVIVFFLFYHRFYKEIAKGNS